MADLELFVNTCYLILAYILIIYCIIGIGMYIYSKAGVKRRTILLVQVIVTIMTTIFFINKFKLFSNISITFCWFLGKMKEFLELLF